MVFLSMPEGTSSQDWPQDTGPCSAVDLLCHALHHTALKPAQGASWALEALCTVSRYECIYLPWKSTSFVFLRHLKPGFVVLLHFRMHPPQLNICGPVYRIKPQNGVRENPFWNPNQNLNVDRSGTKSQLWTQTWGCLLVTCALSYLSPDGKLIQGGILFISFFQCFMQSNLGVPRQEINVENEFFRWVQVKPSPNHQFPQTLRFLYPYAWLHAYL